MFKKSGNSYKRNRSMPKKCWLDIIATFSGRGPKWVWFEKKYHFNIFIRTLYITLHCLLNTKLDYVSEYIANNFITSTPSDGPPLRFKTINLVQITKINKKHQRFGRKWPKTVQNSIMSPHAMYF